MPQIKEIFLKILVFKACRFILHTLKDSYKVIILKELVFYTIFNIRLIERIAF